MQKRYFNNYHQRLCHIARSWGLPRLILTLLSGELDDIKKRVEPFLTGTLCAHDLITVLVPKEKELKVKEDISPKGPAILDYIKFLQSWT